ncbi:MAG TPA: hypothetical protein VFZ94_16490 [Burkholderiales bacterium]|nr:hypothetical protein [Burkholderiales bacterium]
MRTILIALLFAAPAQAQLLPGANDLFLPPHGDEGCWVSFFAGRNFTPPAAQLAGRSYVESFATEIPAAVKPELDHVGGESFFADVSSLIVGPHARLVGYGERNFRGRELVIGPGEYVSELADIHFHERVRSFKLFCEAT